MGDLERRTLLRRAGVVGAVAWTAPVVSSLGASAWAAGSEAPGGGGDGSPGAISYVVLILGCGGTYYTAKFEAVDAGYALSCPGAVSSDDKGCTRLLTTYTGGLVIAPGCPPNVRGYSKAGDLVVSLGDCTLVHYIVHDGSLKIGPRVGTCRGDTAYTRSDGTVVPALTAVSGWSAPATGSTGTVVFDKP